MTTRRRFLVALSGLLATPAAWRDAVAHHVTTPRKGFPHPDPRPGITGENVLAEAEIGERRRVREAYEAARTHPELFDGVYCACECDKSMGHRSLLSCFEGHGMALHCERCQGQARLADRLQRAGTSLDEIRTAIDDRYG